MIANSKAANKIGSGFDVAASIYGTHIFNWIPASEI